MNALLLKEILSLALNAIEKHIAGGATDTTPASTGLKKGSPKPKPAPAPATPSDLLNPNTPAPSWTDPNLDPGAGSQTTLPFATPAPVAPAVTQTMFVPPAAPAPVAPAAPVQVTLDDVLMMVKKYTNKYGPDENKKLNDWILANGFTLDKATPAQLKFVADSISKHLA